MLTFNSWGTRQAPALRSAPQTHHAAVFATPMRAIKAYGLRRGSAALPAPGGRKASAGHLAGDDGGHDSRIAAPRAEDLPQEGSVLLRHGQPVPSHLLFELRLLALESGKQRLEATSRFRSHSLKQIT